MANTNPFKQIWQQGILAPISKPVEKIPIANTDEETNGNKLQQYYNYFNHLNKSAAAIQGDNIFNGITVLPFSDNNVTLDKRLIGLTQIFTENTKLLPYTNVFRNSDQGHDFYTDGRNVRGSFAYPARANCVTLSDYNKFTANTTFGGGSTICALLVMYNHTRQHMITERTINANTANEITYPAIPAGELTSVQINTLINTLINKRAPANLLTWPQGQGQGQGPYVFFKSTTDGMEYDVGNGNTYHLLPLTIKGYDTGMHKLTDFTRPYTLYAVTLAAIPALNTAPTFTGYKLYECQMIIPKLQCDIENVYKDFKQLADIKPITDILNTVPNFSTVTNLGKLRKAYTEEIINYNSRRQIDKILYDHFLTLVPGFALQNIKRGIKFYFNNCKTTDENVTFCLMIIMNTIYRNLSYLVDTRFVSLLPEKNTLINQLRLQDPLPQGAVQIQQVIQLDSSLDKLTAFTTDTNIGPQESSIIKYYRGKDAVNSHYRFTIVSNAIDGSGQGGQIYPNYHPPDLDVYMHIFNNANQYLGAVFRFTFLSNITSNSLNSKSNVFVELHYCYIAVNDFTQTQYINGSNITAITTEVDRLIKNILFNTKVDRNGDILKLTTITNNGQKVWVFNKIDNAPSVELANKATVDATFTNKLNKIKRNMGYTTTKPTTQTFSSAANNIYTSLFSCICSQTVDVIEKFIAAAIILFEDNREVFATIFGDDGEIFCKIFLLRNKFIGDKSRATDAIFMNKNAIYDCVQSSNDDNTLATACMFNLSSQLLAAGSTNKSFYFSPYVSNQNRPLKFAYPGMPNLPGAGAGAGAVNPFTTLNRDAASIHLNDTKAPKSTTKKIGKDDYNAQLDDGSTRVAVKSNRLKAMLGLVGGRVPIQDQQYVQNPGSDVERSGDADINVGYGLKDKLINQGDEEVSSQNVSGESVSSQDVSGEGESGEELASDNAIMALHNKLESLILINNKYRKDANLELTDTAVLINMSLDTAEYLLGNTSNVPLTIDSLIEKMQTYLGEEIKTNQYATYINTSFKTVLDIIDETYMMDIYGISYCYSETIFDDEVVETPIESEKVGEEPISSKITEGETGEQGTGEEGTGEEGTGEQGMGEESPFYESSGKGIGFKMPPSMKITSQLGAGPVQHGGAANAINLKIIYNYYTNNYNDISKRLDIFNKWYNSLINNSKYNAAQIAVIASMTSFVDKNTEIFNVIEKIVTFLNSVNYDELLKNSTTFPDAISTYISLTFFLIKLCTDFRNYLKLIYSYFFRRLNHVIKKPAVHPDAPTDEASLMDESDNLDYINLFEPRYYIDSINATEEKNPENRDPDDIIISEELSPDNLIYVENIFNEIKTLAPNVYFKVRGGQIPMTKGGADLVLPTADLPFFDVKTIVYKLYGVDDGGASVAAAVAADVAGAINRLIIKPNIKLLTPKSKAETVIPNDGTPSIISRRTKLYIESMTSVMSFFLEPENYITSFIKDFFINVTTGDTLANYNASTIFYATGGYVATIDGANSKNFSITVATTAGKSRMKFVFNSLTNSYDITYDKILLKQLLYYIFDRSLHYLIMTPEQKENLFTNYVRTASDLAGGDITILYDLSDCVNEYFKSDEFLPNFIKIFIQKPTQHKIATPLPIPAGATISRASLKLPLEPIGTVKGRIGALGAATINASIGAAVGTGLGYAAQTYGFDTGYNVQIGVLIGSVVGAGGGLLASFLKKKEYEGGAIRIGERLESVTLVKDFGMRTKKHRKSKRKTIKINKNKIKKAKKTRKNKITRKQ